MGLPFGSLADSGRGPAGGRAGGPPGRQPSRTDSIGELSARPARTLRIRSRAGAASADDRRRSRGVAVAPTRTRARTSCRACRAAQEALMAFDAAFCEKLTQVVESCAVCGSRVRLWRARGTQSSSGRCGDASLCYVFDFACLWRRRSRVTRTTTRPWTSRCLAVSSAPPFEVASSRRTPSSRTFAAQIISDRGAAAGRDLNIFPRKRGGATTRTYERHRESRRARRYIDAWDALKILDADPANADRVLLLYSRTSIETSLAGDTEGWNREHAYPRSCGVAAPRRIK